eukprot:1434738-Heterocapsa_arctica.AAC.1
MSIESGWPLGRSKSDNGRFNSTMADSPHPTPWFGKLRPEENWPRSEASTSLQHTLTAASVMKEWTT